MKREGHRFSKRGANKRIQTRVYEYLQEEGEKTYGNIVVPEKVGQTMFNGLVAVWDARPLDDVVDRAIASKRHIKKYPMFLQKAIQERLE